MSSSLSRMMHGVVVAAVVGVVGCAAADKEESVGTDRGAYAEGAEIVLMRGFSSTGHWVSTGWLPADAYVEAHYGIRAHGDIALYSCWTGTRTMASTDPGCEGHQRHATLGYLSERSGIPLYRCGWDSDNFVTTRSDCEGTSFQTLLGYVDSTSTPANYGGGGHEGSGDAPGGGGGDGEGGGVGIGGSL